LFLYTDGVVDAVDPRGEMFGEGRLDEVMGSNAFLPPRDLVEKVTAAVTAWLDGVPQPDDVTALVVRRAVAVTAESARRLTA
jgi:serine phosphatase RsbU (regulator of sigma subunit)